MIDLNGNTLAESISYDNALGVEQGGLQGAESPL
jgi:hypothetical protein